MGDSIASKKIKCQALADFVDARQLLLSQDSTYKRLYKAALHYSLVPKLATKLEKVKATEQNLAGILQASYAKAQAAKEVIPMLNKQMPVLDEKYANLQVVSKKIQEMEYKPFIQRIKDYIIGLACIAILIMAFNMVIAKIQAARKARKSMMQYQDMLKKNGGGNYPTI